MNIHFNIYKIKKNSFIKKIKFNNFFNNPNKHQKFLVTLPRITQKIENFKTLYTPKEFKSTLLYIISHAYHHIYLVALYLENDQGGRKIIDALFQIKKIRPQITIKILVDWHRAIRNRFGCISKKQTNIDWYNYIIQKNPNINIQIYGIPININEALGVLHFKGFIIDDKILYSGANLNNEYLHMHDKYRYDRYHIIQNQKLSETMLNYIEKELLSSKVTNSFEHNNSSKKKKKNKNNIRLFRKNLKKSCFYHQNNATFDEFSITPLVGLGKNSLLNQTIYHLTRSTKNKIILCTPYFNISSVLKKNLNYLLHKGKNIEIIVGDKIANDFYIPTYQPFKLINILPYLYEINLRYFLKKFQLYIDKKQLTVQLWKNENNSYHIKGIWIDDEWQLLTGNNLNFRSLKLDLENALLIHDPKKFLLIQKNQELNIIRSNTHPISHYKNLQKISDYPTKIRKLIYKIRKIRFDLLINRIL